jgi:signal transduction histidine kinase
LSQILKDIVSGSRNAADVVDSIRAMFGTRRSNKMPLDISGLVRETVALISAELTRQNVSLNLELGGDLPRVAADRLQMQHVFLNLFENAIDSMTRDTKPGPRVLSVQSARLDPASVVVRVEDTGVGIDPSETDRIFDIFFTTKTHGTGIGLSLCRMIVEEHGGKIWASPRTPCGATFQVQLPCAGA